MNRALSRRPVGVCLLRPSECTSSWLWLWLCRCGSSSCRWNWIDSEVVVFEYKSPPEKQVLQCDAPDIVVTEEGEESGRVDLKCSNPEGAEVRFAYAEDKLQDGSSVYAEGSTHPKVDVKVAGETVIYSQATHPGCVLSLVVVMSVSRLLWQHRVAGPSFSAAVPVRSAA